MRVQLRPKKKMKIGQILAAASLALLCGSSSGATESDHSVVDRESKKGFFSRNVEGIKKWAKWSGELGFLGYSETNNRVQAWEPAVLLNAQFKDDKVLSTRLVFDSLTGSSPNGALNSDQPQTFTSPSGAESYVIEPGAQPLYSQFKDSRVAVLSSWSQPLSRNYRATLGINGSSEYDYFSIGINASLVKETDDKNRSFSFGVSFTDDQIRPVGGVPVALASMGAPGATPREGTVRSKNTIDLLFGLSQVVSRTWLLQGNISLGLSEGYMNDPYKFVSVFDDVNPASLGRPTDYLFESRPHRRFKRSLFLASKNSFKFGIVSSSYRFFTDDWGIQSHTFEEKLNFAVSSRWRLEPGVRIYFQDAASFYRLGLPSSQSRPSEVSADYRLGDLTTIAPTLKVIRKLADEKEVSILLRYYLQKGSTKSFRPIGSQVGQDLIPDTEAYVVQLAYSF